MTAGCTVTGSWLKRVLFLVCGLVPAHTWGMSRIIWTILGVVLAVWVASMAISGVSALLQTFVTVALIAVVVVIVVKLVAKGARHS